MSVKDHIHLPDFAAADSNKDGKLSKLEALNLIYDLDTTHDSPESIISAWQSTQLIRWTASCSLHKDADGNVSWKGIDLYAGSTPEDMDRDSAANKAAYRHLSEINPSKSEVYGFFQEFSPGAVRALFLINPDLFGGKEGFDAAKAEIEVAKAEAMQYIEKWAQEQKAALPNGIELPSISDQCDHIERTKDTLENQFLEMKAAREAAHRDSRGGSR